jgi:hypothetical protein
LSKTLTHGVSPGSMLEHVYLLWCGGREYTLASGTAPLRMRIHLSFRPGLS